MKHYYVEKKSSCYLQILMPQKNIYVIYPDLGWTSSLRVSYPAPSTPIIHPRYNIQNKSTFPFPPNLIVLSGAR